MEWERRGDILAEIRLQQSRYVDPSTRVTPRLIQPTIFVEGSVTTTRSAYSWNIRAREIGMGRILASDRGTASSLEAVDAIAKRLRKQLEEALCLPPRFTGTFSGRSTNPNLQLAWSGEIAFVRDTRLTPPGAVFYSVDKVDYTVTAIGAVGPCTGKATEWASLAKEDPTQSGLTLARAVTPGKGRVYAIRTSHQRPQPASMTLDCGTTSIPFPWSVTAFIDSGPATFYAEGTTLRGTYTSEPNSSTWSLKGAG